jgi:hypothetical protein
MSVGQKLYSQPGAEGAAPQEEAKADDWVVDAEVEGDDEGKNGNTRV